MTERHGLAVVALAVLAMPPAIGAVYSIAAAVGLVGPGSAHVTLRAFAEVASSVGVWRGVAWTVLTATAATVLATGAACGAAVAFRASPMGRRLAVFPLAVPHVAAALAALLLLGQSGLLSRIAYMIGATSTPADFPALVYDHAGIAAIIALAWKEFPFLALTAFAVLDDLGSRIEEAARTLGAAPRQVARRVTLPLLWRGVAPAVVAVFAFLVGQYDVSVILAPSNPSPLPVLTMQRAADPDLTRRAEAHVLGLIALGLAGILVMGHTRASRGLGRPV